jgi:hypothetical protein
MDIYVLACPPPSTPSNLTVLYCDEEEEEGRNEHKDT